MTIQIGKFQVVLFKVTKLETFAVNIDTEAAKRQVEEIKSSESFQDLKARAAAIRAARGN